MVLRKSPRDRRLSAVNPTLAAEWHPTKNVPLTATDVTAGSGKKAWWLCTNGHAFEARIYNRKLGRGCPFCSGRKASKEYNLAVSQPDIAKEWHPTKNAPLTASDVTMGSGKRIWWRCVQGHEWEAIIGNRVKGRGCPCCSGRLASSENNLAFLYPEIATDWHPTKNVPLTATDVTARSGKKVWWRCRRGHKWQAAVHSRTRIQGTGCPLCSHQTSKPEIRLYCELAEIFDEVSRREKIEGIEVDVFLPTHNIGIEYDGSYYHANRKAQDLRKNLNLADLGIRLFRVRADPLKPLSNADIVVNPRSLRKKDIDLLLRYIYPHVDPVAQSQISQYWNETHLQSNQKFRQIVAYLPGPAPEDSLATLFPDIAAQWHPTKNRPLKSGDFSPGVGYKAWWQCDKGHEWRTAVCDRTGQSQGCPGCSGRVATADNNLALLDPELAAQWHPTENGDLTPQGLLPQSNRKAWWLCEKGHSWEALISNRHAGRGCPYCGGKIPGQGNTLADLEPKIAKEWHPNKNGELTPWMITTGSSKKVWWQCDKGHDFSASVYSRLKLGSGCPYCSGLKVCSDNSLATLFPVIARQWDYENNGDTTPDDVGRGTGRKFWWKCEKGHSWEAAVTKRVNGSGCPYCSNRKVCEDNCLATLYPDVTSEWHPTKNDGTPKDYVAGSTKLAWWQCKNNSSHIWRAKIEGRTAKGSGCPECAKKIRWATRKMKPG